MCTAAADRCGLGVRGRENPGGVLTSLGCWSLSHASLQCPDSSVSSQFGCFQRRDCSLLGTKTSRPAGPSWGQEAQVPWRVSGVMGWGPLLLAPLGAQAPAPQKDPDSESLCLWRDACLSEGSSGRALAVFPGTGRAVPAPVWVAAPEVQCDVACGPPVLRRGPWSGRSRMGPHAPRPSGGAGDSSFSQCLRVYPEIGKSLGVSRAR